MTQSSLHLDTLVQQARVVWDQAVVIWIAGGWAMLAIALVAIFMFGIGTNVYLRLRGKGFTGISDKTLRHWILHPDTRRGPIGALLDEVTGAGTVEDTTLIFQGLRITETAVFERDLRLMKICVGAAPLLGLFGTVTGMLATFGALASGSGGEKTMGLIAQGISEALITTESGLLIALPGLFFHYQLSRWHERYTAFLAHLESLCNQSLYRRTHGHSAPPATQPALAT